MKILVVDDERDLCSELSLFIQRLGFTVYEAFDGREAMKIIDSESIDLLVSDVNLPELTGLDLVSHIQDKNLKTNVILISGKDDIIDSINALELGIIDFFIKPVNISKLAEIIREQALEIQQSLSKKKLPINLEDLKNSVLLIKDYLFEEDYSIYQKSLGKIGIFSSKMAAIYKKLNKLQEYPDIPVLIEGETGTGKEILAQYIHYQNPAIEGPFIGINCSAMPKDLFEAELFGYEKGSFTGADRQGRTGKIHLAEKGTLFLDEITEMPLELQSKLLRVIQEREYFRVGGNQRIPVRTRIVCASNRDILDHVEKGLFREDLYFRLNVCRVHVPSLHERKEEIVPLTIFFIMDFAKQFHRKIESIDARLLRKFLDYKWPGNIRELKNIIQNAYLFGESNTLLEKDVEPFIEHKRLGRKGLASLDLSSIEIPETPFSLEDLNQTIVRKTLEKFGGNKTKAAKFLGLTRIQLYRHFKIEE